MKTFILTIFGLLALANAQDDLEPRRVHPELTKAYADPGYEQPAYADPGDQQPAKNIVERRLAKRDAVAYAYPNYKYTANPRRHQRGGGAVVPSRVNPKLTKAYADPGYEQPAYADPGDQQPAKNIVERPAKNIVERRLAKRSDGILDKVAEDRGAKTNDDYYDYAAYPEAARRLAKRASPVEKTNNYDYEGDDLLAAYPEAARRRDGAHAAAYAQPNDYYDAAY